MEIEPFFRYWGKAKQPKDSVTDKSNQAHYHLLPYHSLDVAACGWLLLSDEYPWIKTVAEGLEISRDQLRRLLVFFLTLHDIGKFSRTFQGLAPGLSPSLVPAINNMPYSERHDSLGFWLWEELAKLQHAFAIFFNQPLTKIRINRQIRIWFEIVTGHHGQPPNMPGLFSLEDYFTNTDIDAACSFTETMLTMWLNADDFALLQDKSRVAKLQHHSWTLAGLTVLADWLGSNQLYFPYCTRVMLLNEYWQQHALPGAQQAVAQAGLTPAKISSFTRLQKLFPFIQQPTPLQHYATQQTLSNTPQLLILEDVTGAGKTEAAIVLTHRLMSQGLANGLYIALPTMATANAMYQRIADCYTQLYQPGQSISLVLAHGARHLSTPFMSSVTEQPADNSYQLDELSASAYCNSWLADSRKKALLAHVGVGTLDQVLLSVLPARHQSLRLLGLAGKVLLVDEVHAYDPYMSTLLSGVLEMHARQRGSAILLSATLPQQMKQQLLTAYARGRDLTAPLLNGQEYPLATQWPAVTAEETPLPTRSEVQRKVRVQPLANIEQVQQLIHKTVKAGQCVCWIRNTVDEARHSYLSLNQQLANYAAGVHLFHSRFAMIDRQRIENSVLNWFGKHSTRQQRAGRVLIATQVVEQSLDLDFDVLITDLAPIDLLLQRAGRLHRHVRDKYGDPVLADTPEQRSPATLYVLSPTASEQDDEQWLAEFGGTLAVYQDLGQLWRSAKVLFERDDYAMPDDARKLIETVYSPDTDLCTPPAVEQASFAAEGKRRAETDMAGFNQLDLDIGYSQNSSTSGWNKEVHIPTRLSDKTVSLVLVRRDHDGEWQPYADHPHFGWDLSTLQIRELSWQQAEQAIPPQLREQLEQLRTQIAALRWVVLWPLVDELAHWYHPEQGWLGHKGDEE